MTTPENKINYDVPDDELQKLCQKAVDAGYGDSNDDEIEFYRDALEEALHRLGRSLPEAHNPEDDES